MPLPSVAILGVDALLAARPATPVQLAHACQAAGYAAAYPATWGDELLSTACVRRVATRGEGPAIFCACPHVSDALLEVGPDLVRFLVPLVAPPVACARYLRALYGHNRVRITYIGACPGAHDPAIDAHLTPIQFFGVLAQLGIDLQQQPEIFESVLPPDRRRYRSIPGGAPTAEILAREGGGRALEEITDADWKTELAQRLLSSPRTLFDVAPSLGCHCAGARPGVTPAAARPSVVALEPPRASSEVVDHSVPVDLDRALPLVVMRAAPPGASPPPHENPAPVAQPKVVETVPELTEVMAAPLAVVAVQVPDESTAMEEHREQEAARHKAAAPVVARAAQTVPLARTEGGQVVPRAYAARRRTPSEGAAAIAPPRVMDALVLEPPLATADPSPAAVASPELPAPAQPAQAPSPEKSAAPRPTPRSVTVPLPSEELKPVPPPPAPSHGQAAIVAAAVTVVIAFVALVALRDGAGHVTSESSGMAAPVPVTLESLPPLTFPLPDSTPTPAVDTSVTTGAETPPRSTASPVESTSVAPPAAPNVTTSPRARRRTPPRRSRAGVIPADTAATRRANADSIERDAIRRELEHRRARLDSIARSLEPNPSRPDR
ncbi:MAG TPA: hypothetical protein VFU01_12955 [Gemmatimonadaceae bacterium]|nr:hypothetical protein [Gemmatimonadaceae bacterium]